MELRERENRNLLTPPPPPGSNNNASSPQPPGNNPLLLSEHYRDWNRLLRKSARLREPVIKFLLNFIVYTGETASLIFTLVTGIVLPEGDTVESVAAIALYLLTCLITATVNHVNEMARKGTRRNNSTKSTAKNLLLNMFMITKPIRYWKLFSLRSRKWKIIEQERSGDVISERSLKALSKLYAADLEDKRIDVHECYFQSIPMTILQIYFLFQAHQNFRLCNVQNLSRLGTILFALVNTAKATSAMESQDFVQTLHFLAYYRSNGQLPMAVYSSDMLSLSGLLNFVCHLLTIFLRFYTAMYVLAISFSLSLLYLAAVFLVNLSVLKLFPQHLLEVHTNPPLGVHTKLTYYVDRFINMFTNLGTRFNKFSERKICRVQVPLVFIQVLHFAVPLALVYSTKYYYDIGATLPSNGTTTANINDTLSDCPQLANWYESHSFVAKISNLVFPVYKSLDDRFRTFNDLFNVFHFLWLFFYLQLLYTCLYAYSELWKRKTEDGGHLIETYPILTGYSFYNVLLRRVIASRDIRDVRRLMLLTVLKEPEFYSLISCMGVCMRSSFTTSACTRAIERAIERLNVPDNEVEMKINLCIRTGHRFLNEFIQIRDVLYNSRECKQIKMADKKLFLGFFAHFDRKICVMSSDRICRIFRALGYDDVVGGDLWGDEDEGEQ